MIRLTEKRFYSRVKRAAVKAGFLSDRIENVMSPGWPDVLLRGDLGIHIYVELKIARGPNARVKVRPEQVNWAETNLDKGGQCFIFAWSQLNSDVFWVIPARKIRQSSINGCRGNRCYSMRDMSKLLSQWNGRDVHVQHAHPALAEGVSRLAEKAKSRPNERADVSIVRRSGISNAGSNRRPHRPESAWWEP